MSIKEQKLAETRQRLSEREMFSTIIRNWADKNKKTFWRYEVSSFYKSYTIRVANLPSPSAEDIKVSSNNRLLNQQQKIQLCDALVKACAEKEISGNSSIDVQIDYVDGSLIAEIVHP